MIKKGIKLALVGAIVVFLFLAAFTLVVVGVMEREVEFSGKMRDIRTNDCVLMFLEIQGGPPVGGQVWLDIAPQAHIEEGIKKGDWVKGRAIWIENDVAGQDDRLTTFGQGDYSLAKIDKESPSPIPDEIKFEGFAISYENYYLVRALEPWRGYFEVYLENTEYSQVDPDITPSDRVEVYGSLDRDEYYGKCNIVLSDNGYIKRIPRITPKGNEVRFVGTSYFSSKGYVERVNTSFTISFDK